MKRWPWLFAGLLRLGAAHAQQLYVDGFDPPLIKPLFPLVGGIYQLPPGPTVNQLNWLLGELAATETTTIAEINEHFDATWLATTSATQTQSFIQSVRTSYPNAVIRDVVAVTPVRITVVIDTPGSSAPYGFVTFSARYSGSQRITLFGVSSYGGSTQYPVDQTLTMEQAADKFTTLSSNPALLVGRIAANGTCSEIIGRNAQQPRATASVFKIWVLGALGRAIADGTITSADGIALVASELASAGVINSEPLGTIFSVRDLALLMIGISDNTATDLLHERLGRTLIGQIVDAYGVAQPDLLKPFLGISEQFHLFRSFTLAESLSYVNGSQAFKNQFLQERIVPLGPNNGGPYLHSDLLTDGSWRASPFDVCRAFGQLRRLPQGSEAIMTIDAALGAQVAQPDVRNRWDRVWYKGGNLGSGAGNHVLTHAWMLQRTGADPYVVIAMANSNAGGIDTFLVQSVTGRILQLVAALP